MIALFDAWCAFSPRTRIICWVSWVAALSTIALFFLFLPGMRDDDALNQQRVANRQRSSTLYHLSGAQTEAQISSVSQAAVFSPLTLQVPNVQLLYWHPSTQGGELAVKAPWEAIVSLFGYLAARGMSVSGFSLKAENDERVLTLRLEPLHEG
ncbi:TPA: DNA utilization protein HofO [Citrobacter amalonaticus]